MKSFFSKFTQSIEHDSTIWCTVLCIFRLSGKGRNCRRPTEVRIQGRGSNSGIYQDQVDREAGQLSYTVEEVETENFCCYGSEEKDYSTSKQKTVNIRAERNLLGQLLILSQSNDISFDKLFQFSLSPVPWSLGTADGCLAKTDKSNMTSSSLSPKVQSLWLMEMHWFVQLPICLPHSVSCTCCIPSIAKVQYCPFCNRFILSSEHQDAWTTETGYLFGSCCWWTDHENAYRLRKLYARGWEQTQPTCRYCINPVWLQHKVY